MQDKTISRTAAGKPAMHWVGRDSSRPLHLYLLMGQSNIVGRDTRTRDARGWPQDELGWLQKMGVR